MADPDTITRLRRAPAPTAGIDRADLTLTVEAGIGIAKLQILGHHADDRFAEVIGMSPPAARRQVTAGGLTVAWLAPGEWLLIGDGADLAARLPDIAERGGAEALAIDLAHARASFLVGGANARDALAAHCPLDLRAEAFPVDAAARSPLGEAGMFVARLMDSPNGSCFRIIVDQTMAAYAVRMIAGPPPRVGALP